MAVYSSVLEMIGNTPMVDVSILSPNPNVRILGKMESQNPAGSVKDRIALSMIEDAEADGTLTPGKTIIEPSSGNTGIALAMIARIKGYPIKIVLPENVSVERRQLLEIFGAEIILSPGSEGSNGAVKRAIEIAEQHPEWAFLYQYANEANPQAHYDTTGPEIWADVPESTRGCWLRSAASSRASLPAQLLQALFAWPRRSNREPSCLSFAMEGGSTSQRAPGLTTSTTSPIALPRSSTSNEPN